MLQPGVHQTPPRIARSEVTATLLLSPASSITRAPTSSAFIRILVLWGLVGLYLSAAYSGFAFISGPARVFAPFRSSSASTSGSGSVGSSSSSSGSSGTTVPGAGDDHVSIKTLHLLAEVDGNASERVPHGASSESESSGVDLDPSQLRDTIDDGDGVTQKQLGGEPAVAQMTSEPADGADDGGYGAPAESPSVVLREASSPSPVSTSELTQQATVNAIAQDTKPEVVPLSLQNSSSALALPHHGKGSGNFSVRFGWLGVSYSAASPSLAATRARAMSLLFVAGYQEALESPDAVAERERLGDHPAAPGVSLRVNLQVLRDLRPWRKHGISNSDLMRTRAHNAQLIERVGNESSGMVTMFVRRGVPFFIESELSGPLMLEYGVGSKGKLRTFMEMLAAVGRAYPLPDVHFIWNVHPWPLLRTRATPPRGGVFNITGAPMRTAPRGLAPILSLCKTSADLDVLYPNMYFGTPRYWWRTTRSLDRAAGNWAWSRRREKMWWRGASGWMWPAAAPRVLTLGQWHSKPWADFAFTSQWKAQLRDWAKQRVRWLDSLPPGVAKIPYGPATRTTMEAVAKYKYALHLPGSYGATYSRTLQFLVWTGATIFFYDCPYYEFYYGDLRPYEQ